MPEVSVLIPTFNDEKYIGQAIQSVLDQTFQDFEILISDNNSTDNTYKIVHSFNDSRIKYYRNNQNVGYTRNVHKLIQLARCKYCVVLCADDYWEKQFLEKTLNLFKKNNNLACVFSNGIVKDELLQRFTYIDNCLSEVTSGEKFFIQHLTSEKTILAVPSNMVFKRELALKVNAFGNFQLIYSPDWEFRLKVSLNGDVGYIKDSLFVYRLHENNLTKKLSLYTRLLDGIACIESVLEYAQNKTYINDFKQLRKRAIKKYCQLYLFSLPVYKIYGMNLFELLLFAKKIIQIDKGVLLNFNVLKLVAIFLPKSILKILRIIKRALTHSRFLERYKYGKNS